MNNNEDKEDDTYKRLLQSRGLRNSHNAHTHGEREKNKERQRQRDRETDRERQRLETDRQTETGREREKENTVELPQCAQLLLGQVLLALVAVLALLEGALVSGLVRIAREHASETGMHGWETDILGIFLVISALAPTTDFVLFETYVPMLKLDWIGLGSFTLTLQCHTHMQSTVK